MGGFNVFRMNINNGKIIRSRRVTHLPALFCSVCRAWSLTSLGFRSGVWSSLRGDFDAGTGSHQALSIHCLCAGWKSPEVRPLDFWALLPCTDNPPGFTAKLGMSGACYCHEVWLKRQHISSRTLVHVSV